MTRSVRARGDVYFRSGRVRIVESPAPGAPLLARVEGSEIYAVRIRLEERTLLAACICPYFDGDLALCKHIWATLLLASGRRLSFGSDVEDLLPDDEADLDELERIAFSWDEDEDGEDGDKDEEDEDEEEEHDEARWTGLVDLAAWRRDAAPARQRPAQPSRWRSVLTQLRFPEPEPPAGPALPDGAQLVYVVDPRRSARTVLVTIAVRSPKKDGSLGKVRPVRLRSNEVSRFADPSDREILAMLDAGNRFRDGWLEPEHAIPWPGAGYLVPRLHATGRLWLALPDGGYCETVRFDDGDPWTFAPEVVRSGKSIELRPQFARGEERMAAADVRAVTSGGFLMTRETIARFAGEDRERDWAAILLREPLVVPEREGDAFVEELLRRGCPLPPALLEELRWSEERHELRAVLKLEPPEPYEQTARATIHFAYGEAAVDPVRAGAAALDVKRRRIFVRDLGTERAKIAALRSAGFGETWGPQVAIDRKRLHSAIPAAIAAGWEVRGAEGAYRTAGELEFTVQSGIDWFDVEAAASFGPHVVRLPRLLAALRKGNGVVPLEDGSVGLIPAEWKARLEPFLALASESTEAGVRFRRNQVLLLDALLAARPEVRFDEAFDRARRAILDLRVASEEPPPTFRGTLRGYQKDGMGWFSFLRGLSFGGCLADDMGLGKTVQVLALLEGRRKEKGGAPRTSLVVMPRSLLFNWQDEASRFTPELRLLEWTGADRVREAEKLGEYDVVLTTYGLLRRDAALLASREFDYVVLDEAQAIKNASSQSAKAALLMKARHRLALSGTPVENHLGELASIFEFLNPGMLRGSSSRVSVLLRDAGRKGEEAEAARTMLARAVRPFILRRTKAQVARELPERVEQTMLCDLVPKQRKLYDELRDYYRASLLGRVAKQGLSRSKMHVLEALLRLRQAACHPGLVDPKRAGETSAKLETLFEELPIVLEERHKAIVFSQFTSFLALVRNELRQRGIAHAYLDGKTRDRAAEVQRFQEDPGIPVFLISLKAGGLGLNLTAAEYVYLLDPWWNPAVEAQAIDRAHRIGQTRSVFAYRLVARDTIEEKILQLQDRKRELADAIISEENSILRQLTPEDLDLLLS